MSNMTMNSTVSGRRSFLRASMAAGLVLLAATAATPATALAKGNDGMGAKALVGSWRVTVTTYPNCDYSRPNPSFDSLLTFGDDGSLIETTSSAQFQPGQRSIGHGRWERTGPGMFRAVSEAFIMFATSPPPPAPPLKRGRQRLEQGIDMTSRDSFESTASVFFLDGTSGGTTYLQGCATASGVRFE